MQPSCGAMLIALVSLASCGRWQRQLIFVWISSPPALSRGYHRVRRLWLCGWTMPLRGSTPSARRIPAIRQRGWQDYYIETMCVIIVFPFFFCTNSFSLRITSVWSLERCASQWILDRSVRVMSASSRISYPGTASVWATVSSRWHHTFLYSVEKTFSLGAVRKS